MGEFDCSKCGSDHVKGERQPDGTIVLNCESCQTTWARVPKSSCPRCGKGDVEEYGQGDSPYENAAAAKEDPAVSRVHVEWRTFRCRKCHYTWGRTP
ncbi:MAG: hypothetical protein ACRDV9_14835 [Acidimicrobiia bacterium]